MRDGDFVELPVKDKLALEKKPKTTTKTELLPIQEAGHLQTRTAKGHRNISNLSET